MADELGSISMSIWYALDSPFLSQYLFWVDWLYCCLFVRLWVAFYVLRLQLKKRWQWSTKKYYCFWTGKCHISFTIFMNLKMCLGTQKRRACRKKNYVQNLKKELFWVLFACFFLWTGLLLSECGRAMLVFSGQYQTDRCDSEKKKRKKSVLFYKPQKSVQVTWTWNWHWKSAALPLSGNI